MPTYEMTEKFLEDLKYLNSAQRARFKRAVDKMVADFKAKRPLRAGLHVKKFQGEANVWEFYYEQNGRALFEYGAPRYPGDVHIIWLRIGTHDIYKGE